MINFQIQKGILLEAQPGFTDAFQEIVDFVNNLDGAGIASVDRSDQSYPRIRIDQSLAGLGGGGGGGGYDLEDDGYEEVTEEFWTKRGLLKMKLWAKDVEVTVEPDSYNDRHVVQSHGGEMVLSQVYMAGFVP